VDVVGVTSFRFRSHRLLARICGMTPTADRTQAT